MKRKYVVGGGIVAPKIGELVQYVVRDDLLARKLYGRVCDATPDLRWAKIVPAHPDHHRRWVPTAWLRKVILP